MRHYGAWPPGEKGSHEQLPPGVGRSHEPEDVRSQTLPAAGVESMTDEAFRPPDREDLGARNHAVLTRREASDGGVDPLTCHQRAKENTLVPGRYHERRKRVPGWASIANIVVKCLFARS